MLGDEIYKAFIFLADNVEFISQGSLNLLLDSVLFSSKLKSVCSVKLFTLSLSSGLINWRAPLFGGGAEEITPMERFLQSDECRRVREQYKRRILAFTDRGFSRLPAELLDGIYLLHPGLQELRGQYSAEHAVWKQVCDVQNAGTHICSGNLVFEAGKRSRIDSSASQDRLRMQVSLTKRFTTSSGL